MQPHRIVEAFDVAEAGDLRFGLRREFPAREQLALQGGEKALAHRVVVGVTDRAHRWPNVDLTASAAKGERGARPGRCGGPGRRLGRADGRPEPVPARPARRPYAPCD